jgi:hypothetical protein
MGLRRVEGKVGEQVAGLLGAEPRDDLTGAARLQRPEQQDAPGFIEHEAISDAAPQAGGRKYGWLIVASMKQVALCRSSSIIPSHCQIEAIRWRIL